MRLDDAMALSGSQFSNLIGKLANLSIKLPILASHFYSTLFRTPAATPLHSSPFPFRLHQRFSFIQKALPPLDASGEAIEKRWRLIARYSLLAVRLLDLTASA